MRPVSRGKRYPCYWISLRRRPFPCESIIGWKEAWFTRSQGPLQTWRTHFIWSSVDVSGDINSTLATFAKQCPSLRIKSTERLFQFDFTHTLPFLVILLSDLDVS